MGTFFGDVLTNFFRAWGRFDQFGDVFTRLLLLLLLFRFQPKMAQQLPLNGSNVYNHNFKTTILHI